MNKATNWAAHAHLPYLIIRRYQFDAIPWRSLTKLVQLLKDHIDHPNPIKQTINVKISHKTHLFSTLIKIKLAYAPIYIKTFFNTNKYSPFSIQLFKCPNFHQSIKIFISFGVRYIFVEPKTRNATFRSICYMKYAFESGCCKSGRGSNYRRHSILQNGRSSFSTVPFGCYHQPIVIRNTFKRWMVSYNDLGVPVHATDGG